MGRPKFINRDKYDLGHIRIEDGRWRVDATNGHVINDQERRIGYQTPVGFIVLAVQEEGCYFRLYAHRLIFETVHGRIPDGYIVIHVNGDRADNRIANLELARGAPWKLTDADVRTMRAARARGSSLRAIGDQFGVSEGHVSVVVRGLKRGDVEEIAA